MQYGGGREIVQLEAVELQKPAEKWMNWKSQSPGLGPEGRGEELQRLVMLEWTFAGSALMITRGEEKMWFGPKSPSR